MISGLTWLLACQLVGEVLVRLTDAPVPGPVVGMVLLFVLLQVRRSGDDATVVRAADGLLRHLQLLFVPAGVGVVVYLGTLRDQALPIAVALLLSWLVGLAAVAGVTVALERLVGRGR
ncbi:CidA/LrgA family protein [Nocardioides ferulae]|uniref:CidA/LrgA family protein n=1 Tax=Nocardioides ferulae TaxID=2340821 RepID=UPI000EB34973|nr:CidA/LrgA family protein [Nocardioides ferulae]